nr:MAG TPA: hypothetical protein [Caudoviricetes sp.]
MKTNMPYIYLLFMFVFITNSLFKNAKLLQLSGITK